MKTFVILGITAAAFVGLAQTAEAQVRRNETYCLDTPMGGGGGHGGGGSYLDCRFATMQQCYATRAGVGGMCMLNPRLAFRGRDGDYRRDRY
jgi:hypothetical protein